LAIGDQYVRTQLTPNGAPIPALTTPIDPTKITPEQADKVRETLVDSVQFSRVWLDSELWEKQEEILRSIDTNRKTAVRACHSSGKTFVAALATLHFLARWEEAIVITTAPTKNQVEKLLWAEIHSAVGRSKYPFPKPILTQLKIGPKRYALGFTTNIEHQDEGVKFQGFHAKNILVILDEAPGVATKIWKAIEGLMASGNVRLLAIGNPTIVGGDFYNAFHSDREFWDAKLTISAFDTPNLLGITPAQLIKMTPDELDYCPVPHLISRRWVYQMIKSLGMSNPFVQSRVFGEFPEQAEDSLIFLSWLDQASNREVDKDKVWEQLKAGKIKASAGIDVAGPGEDETTLCIRAGNDIMLLKAWPDPDPRGELIQELMPFKPYLDNVNVDSAGIGYYLARHLEDEGYPVSDVNVGESPEDKEHFFLLKAELYWGLRLRFEEGDVNGLDDDVAKGQLTTIRWKPNPRGQTVIESKADAKARGIKSPDRAEGVMLAFAKSGMHGLIELWGQDAEKIKDEEQRQEARIKEAHSAIQPEHNLDPSERSTELANLQKNDAGGWIEKMAIRDKEERDKNKEALQAKTGIKSLGKVTTSKEQPDVCPRCPNKFLSQYADNSWKCNACGASGVGMTIKVGSDLIPI
jgi:hypothetical protein